MSYKFDDNLASGAVTEILGNPVLPRFVYCEQLETGPHEYMNEEGSMIAFQQTEFHLFWNQNASDTKLLYCCRLHTYADIRLQRLHGLQLINFVANVEKGTIKYFQDSMLNLSKLSAIGCSDSLMPADWFTPLTVYVRRSTLESNTHVH